MIGHRTTIVAALVLGTGCQDHRRAAAVPTPAAAGSSSAARVTASPTTDEWLGEWKGVEGTYLRLARESDKYMITIANLDGPKTYEGVGDGDHIEFERAGKTETIRAASGEQTGMKWLAGQDNCLVVTFGSEGFCRP